MGTRTLKMVEAAIFAPPQERLFGGWRDLLDDIRELVRGIVNAPDDCRCGDAIAHLSGSCQCCAVVPSGLLRCTDCVALLAACAAQIDKRLADTMRYFPAFARIVGDTRPVDVQDATLDVEHAIVAVIRAFERVSVTTEAFSSGCSMSLLSQLKDGARELATATQRLERPL